MFPVTHLLGGAGWGEERKPLKNVRVGTHSVRLQPHSLGGAGAHGDDPRCPGRSFLPGDFHPTRTQCLKFPQLRHPLPGLPSWGEGEETGIPQMLIIFFLLDRLMVIGSAQPLTG